MRLLRILCFFGMLRILCFFGMHKDYLHELSGEKADWVTIGGRYIGRCSRCNRRTDAFTLTRDMLP